MRAGMGAVSEDGAALAIHVVATVEDFEILRRIDIVSVKVWLLRRWRPAQVFFQTLVAVGESMITFACFGFLDILIPVGYAIGVGALIISAIVKLCRSGRSR